VAKFFPLTVFSDMLTDAYDVECIFNSKSATFRRKTAPRTVVSTVEILFEVLDF